MTYQINAFDFFRSAAEKHAERACINDRGRIYTYREIYQRLTRLAFYIQGCAPAHNQPVVIALEKGVDAVTAILACQYARKVYVPVDSSIPVGRLESILSQLGDCGIVTSSAIQQAFRIPEGGGNVVVVDRLDLGREVDAEAAFQSSIDSDPLYVIFTSGSTGIPKGVTISHRSVIDYIEWALEEYRLDESDVMMSQAPLYFDNSTLDLYLTWAAGACLFIPESKIYSFPVQILEAMRDSGVTTIFWVPSVLVAIANSGLLSKIRVESLKRILFAGETMPVSKINQWVDAYPGCMFSNLYGPTEITVDCTFFTFYERFEGEHLPIGFPCRNTEILLLNESDNRAKYGEIGELCVRGSSLALGYWNDADKSNSVFVQNPLNPSYRDLIYRTGDLARYDQEGRLIFLGRKDTQIKHMGYRIELGDVDAAISGHEKIASVCTLYLEDSRELVAVIVSKSGEDLAAAELKKYCAQKLPKYMIPSRFLPLEELPLTQNGKIDRLKLKSSLVEMRHGRS